LLIEIDGARGLALPKAKKVFNLCHVPQYPYWLFFAEYGDATLGLIPDEDVVLSAQQSLRRPLTTEEAIALCVHDDSGCLVEEFAVWAAASCYKTGEEIMTVFWDNEEGAPFLGAANAGIGDSDWGTPTVDELFAVEGRLDGGVVLHKTAYVRR